MPRPIRIWSTSSRGISGVEWGEVDAAGTAHNDDAAANDLDVTSYYHLATGVILTIATECDHKDTRVDLLPATS